MVRGTAILLAMAAAAAGQTWSELGSSASGSGLSGTPALDSVDAQVILAPDGRPMVAWAESMSSDPKQDKEEVFLLAWSGSSWVSVDPLRPDGNVSRSPGTFSRHPSLAVDRDGNPVVAWSEERGSDSGAGEIVVVRWKDGKWGGFGGSENAGIGGISGTPQQDSRSPVVAVGSSNRPVVAWVEDRDRDARTRQDREIYLRSWTGLFWLDLAGSGSYGGVSDSPDDESVELSLALDSAGRPVVAWSEDTDGNPFTLNREIYVRGWDGASWIGYGGSDAGGGVSMSPASNSRQPQVAVDPPGRPVTAWIEDPPDGPAHLYLLRWNGVSWGPLGSSSTGPGIPDDYVRTVPPALAVDPSGHPVVAWTSNSEVHLRRWNGLGWRGAGGSDGVDGISGPDDSASSRPGLAVRGDGSMFVAWHGTGAGASARDVYLRWWMPKAPTVSVHDQYRLDGATPIPPGAETRGESGFLARARVDDEDGDAVLLEVEVKPVGTPFDGTGTAVSPLQGIPGTVDQAFDALLYDVGYHWRARSVDSTGAASAWVSFGSDPDDPDETDFRPVRNGMPVLRDLDQRGLGGGTALPPGTRVFENDPVRLGGVPDDPDGDAVVLEIEVRPVGTPFRGVPTASGVPAPGGAPLSLPVEERIGGYHWQARVVDALGGGSDWVTYGGNPETEPDFVVVAGGSRNAPIGCGGSTGGAGVPPVVLLGILFLGSRRA